MKMLDVKTLKQKLDQDSKLQLIDVREEYEFNICNISGSKNIPMGEITDAVDDFNSEKELIIICKSGKRAAAVANLLETDYKINNISVVEGGILEYIQEVDSTLEAY